MYRRYQASAVWTIAALACALTTPAARAAQESYITAVIEKGTATGLVVGFRTSDVNAKFVTCTITGSNQTCSKENSNSSIPKNLGNILCLPAVSARYKTSDRCTALIKNKEGSCQTNSAASKCPSGTTAVFPACNYRTSSNSSDAAYWVWNVANDSGNYTVDCLQSGYGGPTPK
jgi:hypothetical protein